MSTDTRTNPPSTLRYGWISLAIAAGWLPFIVVAARKPILAVAAAAAIPACAVAILWPDLYAVLALALIYANVPTIAVRFHGVPLVFGMLVPLLLVIPIVHHALTQRRPVVIDKVFLWVLLFLAVQLFSTLFSNNQQISLQNVAETAIEGALFYLLVFNAVQSTVLLRRIVWALLIAGALLGGLCVFQNATRTYQHNYGGFAQVEENVGFFASESDRQGQVRQQRLGGPLGSQNRFAQIMLMLVPLGLLTAWGEQDQRLRLALFAATGVIGLGLLLTFSRGAAVGAVVMFLVMVQMRYITRGQVLAVLGGVLLLLMLMPQYVMRLGSLGALARTEPATQGIAAADGSLRSRVAEAMCAVYMVADHPWTGVGPGMYPHHFQRYGEMVGTDVGGIKVKDELRQPHVLYLGIAAELGLPGLFAFVTLVGVVLVRLEQARRASLQARRNDLAQLAAALLLMIVAYLSTGLFLHLSYVRYFWLAIALASAAGVVIKREVAASRAADLPCDATDAQAEPHGI